MAGQPLLEDDAAIRLLRRREMVERQIAGRGIHDPAVLHAMEIVPRELFLPPALRVHADEDAPLPIAEGQTISQPYIVALMAQALALTPRDRVLEIGTGSGYGAAVLAEIAREVVTIERRAALAAEAARRLAELGDANVRVVHGDGTRGLPEAAPFDAIVVTAAGPRVPAPLAAQLAPGGRLVIPVGESLRDQKLVRLTREAGGGFRSEALADVRFVPLVGEQGWNDSAA
jgi:protein-L-isoaspartate(D-aspartate) O-methyltransferase